MSDSALAKLIELARREGREAERAWIVKHLIANQKVDTSMFVERLPKEDER